MYAGETIVSSLTTEGRQLARTRNKKKGERGGGGGLNAKIEKKPTQHYKKTRGGGTDLDRAGVGFSPPALCTVAMTKVGVGIAARECVAADIKK